MDLKKYTNIFVGTTNINHPIDLFFFLISSHLVVGQQKISLTARERERERWENAETLIQLTDAIISGIIRTL